MMEIILQLIELSKIVVEVSSTVKIHKSRSNTLSERVKTIMELLYTEAGKEKTADYAHPKACLLMLLASLEEIKEFMQILQTKDAKLGRRVVRYGCDEESFSKWNETLQTSAEELNLRVDTDLFDGVRDSEDFNKDLEYLQLNLKSILVNIPGVLGSVDTLVESNQSMLRQQLLDRTQYKTQQAIRAEKQFDPNLIRYENIIGTGGFGEVWKARYRGDFVAIKKVPSKSLSDQAKFMLRQEAEFMKKLSHPRIVTCFGLLESEGNYCMVMEICVSGSLAMFMMTNESLTVSTEKRIDFTIDIATGMNYLHKLGVIHRDLKLGNVVLDEHLRGKITDFGLSVIKSTSQTSMKLDECGTPQYMAPESFGLAPVFSTKSDVYAFAVVLWELSHWKVAYIHVSILEIKDAIKNGDRLLIADDIAKSTQTLITDCWNANPRQRPTYTQIIDRLQNPDSNCEPGLNPLLMVSDNKQVNKQQISSNEKLGNDKASHRKKNVFKRLFIAVLAFLFLLLIGGGIAIYVYTNPSRTTAGNNATGTTSHLGSTATYSIFTGNVSAEAYLVTSSSARILTRAPYPTATVSTLVQGNNLQGVYGIAIDENDTIYVIIGHDPVSPLVYKFKNGSLSLVVDLSYDNQGGYSVDQGICYFNNALYVPRIGQLTKIDLITSEISKFAGSGNATGPYGAIQDGQKDKAVFCGATMCIADSAGNIYVGESCKAIRMVNQTGFVTTIHPGVPAEPIGFALNGKGKLYFTVYNPPVVYSLDLNTKLYTAYLGTEQNPSFNHKDGQGLSAQFALPNGLTFDEIGNLYIVDVVENYIAKADTNLYVTVFAGNLTNSGLVDGIGSASQFNFPRHIVFDSKGRLIVTDQYNAAIRAINW